MTTFSSAEIVAPLAPLIGLPVWGIRQLVGSFTYLEFGDPHLWIREPLNPDPALSPIVQKGLRQRRIWPEGVWSLTLYMCGWAIFLDSQQLGHCETPRDAIDRVWEDDVAGRKLESIRIDAQTSETVFTFEGGLEVRTWPLDSDHGQWRVGHKDGDSFALRGDGAFSKRKGNTPPSDYEWSKCDETPEIVIGRFH
ncbi:hypothetical protein [Methylocystis heyeri]|uniref:Uncharacterized protein n=1 Tax=Methylocystis heyeri TaxID=391905 RepID=A0A6B8KB63_9HYPH|nr:hypothetical protein [Methylocystis heyeri]QGM44762.1 hypothetical protein H2LOC_003125 [Methylocystis heyeri]